ncbi:MAG: hypothetical protein IJM88_05550 [Bacteroidales bacterium]|nr:hypothetical protein [Bacteroidales bacterium]
MKKRIFWVAAAIGLLAASCAKEEEASRMGVPTPITLKATYDGAAKVAYNEEGLDIGATWEADDTVLVVFNGALHKLHLTAGAGSASATFEGTLGGTPAEGTMLVCYVQDRNCPDGTVTVNADGSYVYSSGAFMGQDGTVEGAGLRNLYCGWVRYSDGADLVCGFGVNTSMLKFTLRAPEGVTADDAATLTYKSGGTALASAAFTVGAGRSNVVYMSVPAGNYSGAQTLVYNEGEANEASLTLSASHAAFSAGQTYNKGIVFGTMVDLGTDEYDITLTDGQVLTGTSKNYTHVTIADGATVTLHDVNITNLNYSGSSWAGVTCEGDATIVLSGTNALKGNYRNQPGLRPGPAGTTLTLRGGGKLTAESGGSGINRYAPGIGCGTDEYGTRLTCGDIVIEGGYIVATGGKRAAGIGSNNGNTCGNITISGGEVHATGGDQGAGIGAGSQYGTVCGDITITGGKVYAQGDYYGAGIGGGSYQTTCGNILISGGTVEATGGPAGTGIGAGGYWSSCGTITIGSTVTHVTAAKGPVSEYSESADYDMGISYGEYSGNPSTCGAISVADPTKVTGTWPTAK